MNGEREVRLLGLEGKNEFLDIVNVLSFRYDNVLQGLGLSNYNNLVEIVRNKIYDMAEKYEIESENFFYCSLSGNIIVQMFTHILETEYQKLMEVYSKIQNNSLINRFIYYCKEGKLLAEYENLCTFCKKFEIEQVKDEFFQAFMDAINKEPFVNMKDKYIKSFKIELKYLAGNGKLSDEFDKVLVKSIGGSK